MTCSNCRQVNKLRSACKAQNVSLAVLLRCVRKNGNYLRTCGTCEATPFAIACGAYNIRNKYANSQLLTMLFVRTSHCFFISDARTSFTRRMYLPSWSHGTILSSPPGTNGVSNPSAPVTTWTRMAKIVCSQNQSSQCFVD